jgi:uncharacterized protein YciI
VAEKSIPSGSGELRHDKKIIRFCDVPSTLNGYDDTTKARFLDGGRMPFFVEVRDKPNSQHIRAEKLDEHLAYLDSNVELLLAAGGLLNDEGTVASGGFYILDVDDRAKAEGFVAQDPFTIAGLFEIVQVTRWRRAYFNYQRLI